MNNIRIITTNRAEYSLLKPIYDELIKYKNLDTKFIVSGAHLLKEYGHTVDYIKKDGVLIDKKINIFSKNEQKNTTNLVMAKAMKKFDDYFKNNKTDLIIILGDRYETLAIATSAFNISIPIAHIHGGEKTVGAKDDSIRHAITKLSNIHFTSTEEYKKRVIQLGENPNTVHNVGATGVENIKKLKLYTKKENAITLKINENTPYAICTFHPVTHEENEAVEQIHTVLKACEDFKNITFIFTKANTDIQGKLINKIIDDYTKKDENIKLYDSLGMVGYLSAVKHSLFCYGNSSSGIIEAPTFNIPTVNIGNRQQGRTMSNTVISTPCIYEDIKKAINRALSQEFTNKIRLEKNPYEGTDTSKKIARIVMEHLKNGIELKKDFYDINFKI